MKTVFDYKPTTDELDDIGFNSFVTLAALGVTGDMTHDKYVENVSEDKAIFDIALLFELRNQDASVFWTQIPQLYDEYMRGFDYEQTKA